LESNSKKYLKEIGILKCMGRIKLQLIKRTTRKLMEEHKGDFKEDFEENKKMVGKYTDVSNKKLRNTIAGYVTKLMKKKEEE